MLPMFQDKEYKREVCALRCGLCRSWYLAPQGKKAAAAGFRFIGTPSLSHVPMARPLGWRLAAAQLRQPGLASIPAAIPNAGPVLWSWSVLCFGPARPRPKPHFLCGRGWFFWRLPPILDACIPFQKGSLGASQRQNGKTPHASQAAPRPLGGVRHYVAPRRQVPMFLCNGGGHQSAATPQGPGFACLRATLCG